jgi:hypothetical protein
MQCMQGPLAEIKMIADGSGQTLYQNLKKVSIKADDDNSQDAVLLSRMTAANVDHEDPELIRRCSKLVCSCLQFDC